MSRCKGCGRSDRSLRSDGECFGCHIRGIGFTYSGGAEHGRAGWNTTQREFIDTNIGEENIRAGRVERAG